MDALFPGYFRLPDEQVEKIWTEAIFVFDTNTLLNLYRYSETTRNDVIKILVKLKSENRVWLPHQVAFEYLKGRAGAIHSQVKAYTDTMSALRELEGKFDNKNQHPFLKEETKHSLEKLFSEITDELAEGEKIHKSRFHDDPIKNELTEIFKDIVGSPFSEEQLIKLFKDGEGRYKNSVPPGYKDINKGSSNDFTEKMRIYGDLILWQQTLDMAKDKKRDVIFITDDQKEDWWLIEHNQTFGARPELIAEFNLKAGGYLLMYRPGHFVIEAQNKLGSNINPATVSEIKQVEIDNDLLLAMEKYPALVTIIKYLIDLQVDVGDSIPSERDLAKALNINRSLVREHLTRLESHGYIVKQQGKSTRITRTLPDIDNLNDE